MKCLEANDSFELGGKVAPGDNYDILSAVDSAWASLSLQPRGPEHDII